MTWILIVIVSVIIAAASVFVGTYTEQVETTNLPEVGIAAARTADVSAELVFYGGLTGSTEVARVMVKPLPVEDAGDGEYRVEVPGAERPVYLSDRYAVVYFEPVELSAAHALIMTDSAFELRAGGRTYGPVMPRPIYPDGGWDAMFYEGAVAFEPVPAGSDATVTLNVPYSVDPGTPAAVTFASAEADVLLTAFYPPGLLKTWQIKGKLE